jgi:hypothetical protein
MVEGVGSAQFVAETLVQMMQARRPPDAENPRMGQVPPSPFLNRTGLRVMADAFSASDTPSLTHFEGKPLAGSYAVDDEGMRAKDVTLVEKGRLASLLTGRVPQKNFPRSNGHGRSTTVLAGVFQIESAQAIRPPSSRTSTSRCSRRRTRHSATSCGRAIGRTGRRHRSRHRLNCEGDARRPGKSRPRHALRVVSPMAFRDLAEASTERHVFSYRAGATSAVSVIAPSLIFEELGNSAGPRHPAETTRCAVAAENLECPVNPV